MTTRPSSSRPAPFDPGRPMVDSEGRTLILAAKVGSGGEGTVYRLSDRDDLVVKLYHQHPLPAGTVTKLKAMLARASADLDRIAAWPRGLVFDAQTRQPTGFLMPMIRDARGMHDLYGTTSRRKHFPDIEWHHLILAARNTAAAFDTMHRQGIVIGDVNQGNLLVDQDMCVRFIDCDSFQIQTADSLFRCPVGTPHFTPPELQGMKLDSVDRTPMHDEFGLAILIFHLLFVGRHPFAGRIQGSFDVTIESAISQRLFAYSKKLDRDQVLPPPCSLSMNEIPDSLAALFEAAFRCDDAHGAHRPTARHWVEVLDQLLRRRKRCDLDASHIHWSSLAECPWCRIETQGGPSHFLAYNRADTVWDDRVADIEQGIGFLPWTIGPYVDPQSLQLADWPRRIQRQGNAPIGRLEYASGIALASVPFCGIAFFGPQLLVPAGLTALAAGGYLQLNSDARRRRSRISGIRRQRRKLEKQLRSSASQLVTNAKLLLDQFRTAFEPLFAAIRVFQVHGNELLEHARQWASQSRENSRAEYLQKFLIREQCGLVRGLTREKALMLQRYGILAASDIDPHMLQGIPNINPSLQIELVNWRNQLYDNYSARPRVAAPTLEPSEQRATMIRDFKSARGQDVLFEAKRVRQSARKINDQFARDQSAFERLKLDWQKLAQEFVAVQQERFLLERLINNSIVPLLIVLLGLTCIGIAVWRWIG